MVSAFQSVPTLALQTMASIRLHNDEKATPRVRTPPLPLWYRQRSKWGLRIFNVHNCHWREKSLISISPTSWEANWFLFTLFFIILMSGLCLKYIYLLSVITFWRDLPTGRLRIFSWPPAPSIFVLVSFNWMPCLGNLKPCAALLSREGDRERKKSGKNLGFYQTHLGSTSLLVFCCWKK